MGDQHEQGGGKEQVYYRRVRRWSNYNSLFGCVIGEKRLDRLSSIVSQGRQTEMHSSNALFNRELLSVFKKKFLKY